jgi:CrcB protein
MNAMLQTVAVALGGALGSVARFWVGVWLARFSGSLPIGTIVINVVGSFAISFFGTLTLAHGKFGVPEIARVFFMVGVCGGFTTFSSFSLQTLDLLRAGAMGRAMANIGVSVALCLVSVAAGHLLAAQLNGGAVQIVQNVLEEEA